MILYLKKISLFVCLLFSFSVFAQDKPDSEEIPEIKVLGDSPFLAAPKPSAFSTILEPKLYERQVKTLPELLSQQPGVNIQQFGGLGQFSTVSLRGSTSEQVTVLVDGVRINTAQGGAVDFSSLPLDAIERIEIIRGGASSQFGSDAVGGVIHIITKQSKKKLSFEGSLGAGSFGTFKSNFGVSKNFNKFGFVFNYNHLQSDGDFSFKKTTTQLGTVTFDENKTLVRENNRFSSDNFLLKLSLTPKENYKLSLTSDFFISDRQVPPTEDEFVLLTPANLPEAKQQLFKNLTTLRFEQLKKENSPYHWFIEGFYHYDRNHFEDASPALGVIGANARIDRLNQNQSFGGKASFGAQWTSNFQEHRLQVQYEIKRDRFNDENRAGGTVSGLHQRLQNAFFISDEIELFPAHLTLYPSLRFEHASDFGWKQALNLGLKWDLHEGLAFKANVGNSFRYPNFNELYLPDQGILRGNPNLKPETAFNVDAGFEWSHSYGKHQLSYFFNRIGNSIVFVPVSAFTIAPLNTNLVRTQGIEFYTALTPTAWFELEANYNLLLAKLQPTGSQLPGRPRHKANAKVTFKKGGASLYSNLQWIDHLPLNFQNTASLKQRLQVDVGASFEWQKHYFISLEFKNITNTQMLDARGFPLPRFSVFGSFGVKL